MPAHKKTPAPAPDAAPQDSGGQLPVVVTPKLHPFHPGHARLGGRKPGSPTKRTKEAREIAELLGLDPVRWLGIIIMQGIMMGEDDTFEKVDAATRLDAMKTLLPYLLPKLNAVTVTGANGGPVAVASLDVTQIMMNPTLSAAAQELALMVVEQEAESTE